MCTMAIFRSNKSGFGCSFKDLDTLCCQKCCWPLVNGKLRCDCGEKPHLMDWVWENGRSLNSCVVSNGNRDVLFHPIYSSGTAVARGMKKLEKNMHYFYEVKVLTSLYGTDIMVGIGSSKMDLSEHRSKFVSLLGYDDQSWGYSYRGIVQHDGLTRKYGDVFGLGSYIGVHIDMYNGTLEYYLNRQPLGVAFKGLRDFPEDLYPMVSSTAAQSSVRLTCSVTFESSLQFEALRKICHSFDALEKFYTIPALCKFYQHDFFWMVPEQDEPCDDMDTDVNNLELEDEVVIPTIEKSELARKRSSVNKWGLIQKPGRKRYIFLDGNKICHAVRRKNCKCIKTVPHRRLQMRNERNKIEQKECKNRLKDKDAKVVAKVCNYCLSSECQCIVGHDKMDVYADLPNTNINEEDAGKRYCAVCNFQLGTHEECLNTSLCSLCEVLL